MKKMLKTTTSPNIKRPVWAITMVIIMSLSSIFTLFDAFVLPKAYAIIDETSAVSTTLTSNTSEVSDNNSSTNDSSSTATQSTTEVLGTTSNDNTAVITPMSYIDENISITIETFDENNVVYYVADIVLSDVSYLKTAFAENTFGKNITEKTSVMAEDNQAIFAINGDYYGFRDTGLIIRNGVLYRDVARNTSDNQSLTIDSSGQLSIVTEGDVTGEDLIEAGVLQSFSFGPALVEDGVVLDTSDTSVSKKANPRTAIGQISPLHYIIIVVDGRTDESNGMTLEQLAQAFVERNATVAYNLDGGGSSTMWLNGAIINNPTDGRKSSERAISDIIYFN